MESITISDDYAVINSSSSKGIRQKFYMPETNVWFKQDLGIEEEISNLLSNSSLSDYVRYKSIIVNGKPFCSSSGFLATGEEEITFARIIEHMTGKKAGDFVFRYREIKDRFNAVTDLIEKYTKVNVVMYVKTLLYLDMLIGNPDRHFNNMAMIHNIMTDKYYPAPIFDNGAALSKDNPDMCGNFGGKHEYVLSSIGSINSPIRFDYDNIGECDKVLKDRLLKYESIFRYTGKFDIKEYGRMLMITPPYLTKDGTVDYVDLVESGNSQ